MHRLLLLLCLLSWVPSAGAEPAVLRLFLHPLGKQPVTLAQTEQTVQVLRRRLEDAPPFPIIEHQGPNQIKITLPEGADVLKTRARIEQKGGKFELKSKSARGWKTELTGDTVKSASLVRPQASDHHWGVGIEFTAAGTRQLAALTQRYLGKPLGVFVDGKLLSSPMVQEPITGGSVVVNALKQTEAEHLVGSLRSAPYPVKVVIMSRQY